MKIIVEQCNGNEGIISIDGKEIYFQSGYALTIRAVKKSRLKYKMERMEFEDDYIDEWVMV